MRREVLRVTAWAVVGGLLGVLVPVMAVWVWVFTQHSDTVECHTRDVEFQGDSDETGHGVVEEYFGGHRELDISRVGHVEDHLHIFGTSLRSKSLGFCGFIVVFVVVNENRVGSVFEETVVS